MTTYALLLLPSVNRVYADAAAELTVAELDVFSRRGLGGALRDAEVATIGGVRYVGFTAPTLSPADLALLANASGLYALFEVCDDLLRPVPLARLDRFDDDLVTIQKYAGKTNEQFTKLLLNVTLLSTVWATELTTRRLRVLDPLCGRGTTLNQVLTYGYDAAGVDLDAKDFEAYSAFIRTYLQRKRIKHKADVVPVRRERKLVARRLTVSLEGQSMDVVNADTTQALEFFRPNSFDAIVADAPYGVQHGSRTVAKGLRRSPLDLLREATPVWTELLRPGGAMGIAWNTYVAKREDAIAVLAGAGLEVLDDGPYQRFRHRVDQAITRDILIGQKPPTI
jgi:SAM-dependent methyltransferase